MQLKINPDAETHQRHRTNWQRLVLLLKRFVVFNTDTAPATPVKGEIYYDTGDDHFYGWNGSAWKQLDN